MVSKLPPIALTGAESDHEWHKAVSGHCLVSYSQIIRYASLLCIFLMHNRRTSSLAVQAI